MLVDDDHDDQELFESAVEQVSTSLQFVGFLKPEEALSKLTKEEVQPDLVFLDLNMPTMTGKEFLEHVKQHTHLQNIPVIVLTTSSRIETKEEMLNIGASRFFTKPNSFEELKKIIFQALTN